MLFDTNVVLDVLLDREPFASIGAHLFSYVERGALRGYLCATTVTTVHYLTHKALGAEQARQKIRTLMRLFEVAPVNRAILEAALASRLADFEDAVMHEAALHIGAEGIVTRDPSGFKGARLSVYAPEELWKALQTRQP
ncbi:MAG: PIN domain-containing protein [Candidatus Omnitrophica bacterium]|nr:PIN domain-containing protein [Candidatus Omnitrophota bacterium]